MYQSSIYTILYKKMVKKGENNRQKVGMADITGKGLYLLLFIIIALQTKLMLRGDVDSEVIPVTTVIPKQSTNIELKNVTINTDLIRKPFNRNNPNKAWCPEARCYNSPVCSPCNRRYLFIVATGRSGSTSLLKMFNHLPNVRISGENWNELYHASQLLKTLESNPHFISRNDMKLGPFMHRAIDDGPFLHNAMPKGSFACVMHSFIKFLNPPRMDPRTNVMFDEEEESKLILGAKVIRLQQANWTTNRARRFLTESFPCARFIINIRSGSAEQAKSMVDAFAKTDFEETYNSIQNQTSFLKELSDRLGQKAKLIDMDEWKDDVSILNNVLDWLGFENCSFNTIIHENHDTFGRDNSNLDLGPQCRYPTT